MNKFLLFFIGTFIVLNSASAQREFGVATSNWSGTSSLYLNPANIADNREKFSIDIISANVGADNNLGTFNSVTNLINRAFKGSNSEVSNLFNYGNNNYFSLIAPYVEVRGPGFLINIKQKHTLALTTRVRAYNQFNNFGKTLYQIITDPSAVPAKGEYPVFNQNFNWTAQLWSEVGLTYSTILLDKGHSRLKGGITVRYLNGAGYVGLKGKNLDVYYKVSNDSLHANNSDFQYASNVLSTNNAFQNGLTSTEIVNTLFKNNGAKGLGTDIGFVYEYRNDYEERNQEMGDGNGGVDYSKSHYKFRISASVTDIGHITYSNNNYSANVTGNGDVLGKDVNANANNFNSFMSYVGSKGFHADTSFQKTKVYLPTAMLFSVDYHAAYHVYINAAYMANIANRQNFGNTIYNQVTVTPRYDMRSFSFGIPLTYSALAQDFKMGFGIRAYGFYIGSDDMFALFSNNHYGVNLYLGAHVPINHRPLTSRARKGATDETDNNPEELDNMENRGATQKDGNRRAKEEDNDN